MKIGSLFDGSGTAPLAAAMCGIQPAWASEIEKYPIKVTTARLPGMLHLGDITQIDGAEVEPVDIICGGSPCQDLSVAGKQAGLHEGERSHLFFEMTRIIKQMRGATNGQYPRYVIWENVPGAFSSNKGRDFLAVLQAFAEIADANLHVPEPETKNGKLVWTRSGEIVGDGWSIVWRTLDAQYWGVPQRRKRIYLVTDFASERAREVLFEREGLSGNPEPCEEAREGAADNAAGGAGGSDRACLSFHLQQDPISSETIAPCLSGQDQASVGLASFMGGQGPKAGGLGYAEEIAPTLKAAPSGANTVPDVVYAINDKATRNRGGGPTRHDDGAANGFGVQNDGVMYTLDTASRHAVCYPETARCLTARYDGSPCADRGPDVVCHSAGFNDATGERAQGSMEYCEECSPTLRAGDVKSVVYDTTQITSPYNGSNPQPGNPSHPLCASAHVPLLVCNESGKGYWMPGFGCIRAEGENRPSRPGHLVCFAQNQREEVRDLGECSGTLAADAGSHQQSYLAYVLQGNGIDRADTAGCNGCGWKPNVSYTLNTIDRHAVCYQNTVGALCAADWRGPNSQYVGADKLVVNPLCTDARGNGDGSIAPCVTGDHERRVSDYTALCVGNGQMCNITMAEVSNTLDCMHDQQAILTDGKPPRKYIVRRLTPLECCRLQGFPNWWTDGCEKYPVSDWWEKHGVNPHGAVEGSDSAKYKMWGNGMALPCMLYIMQNIADSEVEQE